MDEPFFNLNIVSPEAGERLFRCTGTNTELYLHAPNYRDVDHLFHRYDGNDKRLGAFVFRQILGEQEFEKIKQYMTSTGTYPIAYRPEPTESDMYQFIQWEMSDIETE